MENRILTQITFGSFIKMFSLIFLSIGCIGGIIVFSSSIFGGNTVAHLGSIQLKGIYAGVSALAIMPIGFYVLGLIWGAAAFLPFHLFLKVNRGIKLKMKLE